MNLIIIPANDAGRFNLKIDGINRSFGGANGDTTGAIYLLAGTHTVSYMRAPNSGSGHLVIYGHTIGGDCAANGIIVLAASQHATCTVKLTRGQLSTSQNTELHAQQVAVRPVETHGTWTKGPGTHSFSICAAASCDVVADPGQTVTLTIEAWSAGGGGSGGHGFTHGENEVKRGGDGGGGAGGGMYAKKTVNAVAPATMFVSVGYGGDGGHYVTGDDTTDRRGHKGGDTSVGGLLDIQGGWGGGLVPPTK